DTGYFLHLYRPVVLADYERSTIGPEAPPSFGIVYQLDDARRELLRTLRRNNKSMISVANPIAIVTHVSNDYWQPAGHRLGGASCDAAIRQSCRNVDIAGRDVHRKFLFSEPAEESDVPVKSPARYPFTKSLLFRARARD